jgi:hypothetical protein
VATYRYFPWGRLFARKWLDFFKKKCSAKQYEKHIIDCVLSKKKISMHEVQEE